MTAQTPAPDPTTKTDAATLDSIKSLAGHPGNLTPKQEEALETFRSNLIAAKLYTPASADHPRASHTDTTLLRFLRARRFDAPKAQQQFTDAEKWRKKHNVDELYRTFPIDEFEDAKRFYPTWTGRRDKRGIPLYVYRLGELDSKVQKELSSVPVERRYQRIVALYEYMMNGVLNLSIGLAASTPKPQQTAAGVPDIRAPSQITAVTTIIDLSSVSLSSLWSMRAHLQQSSTLATANYPETLDSIFVVNAPSFFPTAWGWIKGWFDAGTRDKIKILANPAKDPNTLSVLTRFIDKQNLPRMYGGDLDWTTGQSPNLDEPAREWLKSHLGIEQFRGPVVVDPESEARPAQNGAPPPADTPAA